MANQEQLQILKQGVDVWNQWRRENPTTEIDLSKADFREGDLSGVNLREADLWRANLSGADLSLARLSGADLSEADLSLAKLSGADLSEANLFRANLRRANLRRANLRRTNLHEANLFETNLSETQRHQVGITKKQYDTLRNINAERKEMDKKQNASQQVEVGDSNKSQPIVVEREISKDYMPLPSQTSDEEPHEPKVISKNKVFFTAYHPTFGTVETWYTLLVYAHISRMLGKVRKDAKRYSDQIKMPKEIGTETTTPLAPGTQLTIVPSCEGITFNPERISFRWMEDFNRADFRFMADQSLLAETSEGEITIFVGPLIIGTLNFTMLFNKKRYSSFWDWLFKRSQPAAEHEERGKMYGKDDVFISYSRKDTKVARACKIAYEALGLDVFLDEDDLMSGQYWQDELYRRIKRAKIFQIYWSKNYSQSTNCEREWKYALTQKKGEGFIRPVFWKKPLSPKPPKELNKFNFKYVDRKALMGE